MGADRAAMAPLPPIAEASLGWHNRIRLPRDPDPEHKAAADVIRAERLRAKLAAPPAAVEVEQRTSLLSGCGPLRRAPAKWRDVRLIPSRPVQLPGSSTGTAPKTMWVSSPITTEDCACLVTFPDQPCPGQLSDLPAGDASSWASALACWNAWRGPAAAARPEAKISDVYIGRLWYRDLCPIREDGVHGHSENADRDRPGGTGRSC